MRSVDAFGDYTVPYRPFSLGVTPDWFKASLGPVAPTDWTRTPVHTGFHWITMSECYVLEEQAAPGPGPLFIAGNGVDAYVQNDTMFSLVTPAYRFEAQVRFRDFATAWMLCNANQSNDRCGIVGTDLQWQQKVIPLSPLPSLGFFGQFRVERDFDGIDDHMKVFWNGAKIGDLTTVFQDLFWNRMAGNRPTPTPEWGDLDMKEVKIWEGAPPGDVLTFDMDCVVAACDVGPEMIKGTTFNMSLPSCP